MWKRSLRPLLARLSTILRRFAGRAAASWDGTLPAGAVERTGGSKGGDGGDKVDTACWTQLSVSVQVPAQAPKACNSAGPLAMATHAHPAGTPSEPQPQHATARARVSTHTDIMSLPVDAWTAAPGSI